MIITKSLYVAFTKSPKLARWQVNDKLIYKKIQEKTYGGMDGIAIGQSVEDIVKNLYAPIVITEIDTTNMRKNRHQTYHDRTMEMVWSDPEILYQPAFLIHDVFVKCDFLKRNEEWMYDLIEVKAKNTIRKSTKAQSLLDDLVADVSIQAWVLRKVLGSRFSGKCFLAHTNKEYRRQWNINPSELIIVEEITDELLDNATVDMQLELMRETLVLSQELFDLQYPYDGTDYFTYFGIAQPKNSLWSISRLWSKKKAQLYANQKIALWTYWSEEIDFLKNAKWEETTASTFVEKRMQWETVLDRIAIEKELKQLTYPLYFYDYETISSPIPRFDGISPRQQVVVQYSLHVITQDWTITHFEDIIAPWENSTKRILHSMIDAMSGVWVWTFIVRYKWFENSRNTEWWKLFPEFAEALQRINNQTFDLMEVFKKQFYFDRRFEGSCSIKKVLPVLTEISYDKLNVMNGAVAMQKLTKLHCGSWELNQLMKIKKDLLTYCKLDTWAMVRIWQEISKRISE